MRRAELTIDEPLEEDIANLSPYFSTPGSSVASSNGSLITPTLSRPAFPRGFNLPHISASISHKKSLGQLNSPSSPVLTKFARPAQLTRSQTLPRVYQLETKPKARTSELDGLETTLQALEKMRRWIIGIAIGV
jgi:hypothetical protein